MPTKTELMYRELLEQHGIALRQVQSMRAIIRQMASDLEMLADECASMRGQLNER